VTLMKCPAALNPRGSMQLGARVRYKTERGDRGDHRDMLTNRGDGRRWSDFEEGRTAVELGSAKSPTTWASRSLSK
jgi:hypothetical protein